MSDLVSLIMEYEDGQLNDEETINLVRYQRAYQAMAKYITIVDEAFEEILALV